MTLIFSFPHDTALDLLPLSSPVGCEDGLLRFATMPKPSGSILAGFTCATAVPLIPVFHPRRLPFFLPVVRALPGSSFFAPPLERRLFSGRFGRFARTD